MVSAPPSSALVTVMQPWITSGPSVDSMILSMAEPRSEEEAVQSEASALGSGSALECTSAGGPPATPATGSRDTEEESGR